jgi:hypothetical protein
MISITEVTLKLTPHATPTSPNSTHYISNVTRKNEPYGSLAKYVEATYSESKKPLFYNSHSNRYSVRHDDGSITHVFDSHDFGSHWVGREPHDKPLWGEVDVVNLFDLKPHAPQSIKMVMHDVTVKEGKKG